VGAVKHSPQAAVVGIENARLAKEGRCIASAFLERLVTDPEPLFFSTGTGSPIRRRNDLIVAISTNYGTVSEDLMNRALPIHLAPVGDVADRRPSIGNPKYEFLPRNCERIVAEFRGMIEKWKEAGMPVDAAVKHPFGPWSQVIGSILAVNGFTDFLGNYAVRRTADDPVRRGLGLLGAARRGEQLRAGEWAQLAVSLGLVKKIIPPADQDSDCGRERGIGVVLSAHREETFFVQTDDEQLALQLKKARRRFGGDKEPTVRYWFEVLGAEPIPEEAAPDSSAAGASQETAR
jgi:hypothetical protein